MDQALTGRGDGENYAIGFVSVADHPYAELIEAVIYVSNTMYRQRGGYLLPHTPR